MTHYKTTTWIVGDDGKIDVVHDLIEALLATLDDCKECDGYATTMCLEPGERNGTTIPCPRCAQARAALVSAGVPVHVRSFP